MSDRKPPELKDKPPGHGIYNSSLAETCDTANLPSQVTFIVPNLCPTGTLALTSHEPQQTLWRTSDVDVLGTIPRSGCSPFHAASLAPEAVAPPVGASLAIERPVICATAACSSPSARQQCPGHAAPDVSSGIYDSDDSTEEWDMAQRSALMQPRGVIPTSPVKAVAMGCAPSTRVAEDPGAQEHTFNLKPPVSSVPTHPNLQSSPQEHLSWQIQQQLQQQQQLLLLQCLHNQHLLQQQQQPPPRLLRSLHLSGQQQLISQQGKDVQMNAAEQALQWPCSRPVDGPACFRWQDQPPQQQQQPQAVEDQQQHYLRQWSKVRPYVGEDALAEAGNVDLSGALEAAYPVGATGSGFSVACQQDVTVSAAEHPCPSTALLLAGISSAPGSAGATCSATPQAEASLRPRFASAIASTLAAGSLGKVVPGIDAPGSSVSPTRTPPGTGEDLGPAAFFPGGFNSNNVRASMVAPKRIAPCDDLAVVRPLDGALDGCQVSDVGVSNSGLLDTLSPSPSSAPGPSNQQQPEPRLQPQQSKHSLAINRLSRGCSLVAGLNPNTVQAAAPQLLAAHGDAATRKVAVAAVAADGRAADGGEPGEVDADRNGADGANGSGGSCVHSGREKGRHEKGRREAHPSADLVAENLENIDALALFEPGEDDDESDLDDEPEPWPLYRRPAVLWFLGSVGLGLVLLLVGIILHSILEWDSDAFRWFYFFSAMPLLYYTLLYALKHAFMLLEWWFFHESLLYLVSMQQKALWLLFFLALLPWYCTVFWWAWCSSTTKSPHRCHQHAYKQATRIMWNILLCLMLFSLANLLKAVLAKLLTTHFYRTAHFKKLKKALEKEYVLQILSRPRRLLVAARAPPQPPGEGAHSVVNWLNLGSFFRPTVGTITRRNTGAPTVVAAAARSIPEGVGTTNAVTGEFAGQGVLEGGGVAGAAASKGSTPSTVAVTMTAATTAEATIDQPRSQSMAIHEGPTILQQPPSAASLPVLPDPPGIASGKTAIAPAAVPTALSTASGEGESIVRHHGPPLPTLPPRAPRFQGSHALVDGTPRHDAAASAPTDLPVASSYSVPVVQPPPHPQLLLSEPSLCPAALPLPPRLQSSMALPPLMARQAVSGRPASPLSGTGEVSLAAMSGGLPVRAHQPYGATAPAEPQSGSAFLGQAAAGDPGGRREPGPVHGSWGSKSSARKAPFRAASGMAGSDLGARVRRGEKEAVSQAMVQVVPGGNALATQKGLRELTDAELEKVRTAIVIKTQSALISKYMDKSDEDMAKEIGRVRRFAKALFFNVLPPDAGRNHLVHDDFLVFFLHGFDNGSGGGAEGQPRGAGAAALEATPLVRASEQGLGDVNITAPLVAMSAPARFGKHEAKGAVIGADNSSAVEKPMQATGRLSGRPSATHAAKAARLRRARLLAAEEAARKAFAVFDADGNGKVTRSEMREAVVNIYKERRNMARSLKDTETIVQSLEFGIGGVIHFVFAAVYLLIWGVDLLTGFSTFSATVLALTFVFGNSVKNMYESMLFLFVTHPYDVGDCILVGTEMYRIKKISLLYTDMVKSNGERMYMPNTALITQGIVNWTRSKTKSESCRLVCDIGVAWEVREDIQAALRAYAKEHSGEFDGEPSCNFRELADPLKVVLVCSWTYNFAPDEFSRLSPARNGMLYIVQQKAREHRLQNTTITETLAQG